MGNRRKIRMLALLAISLILSHSIFESIWEASDPNPNPPFHEYRQETIHITVTDLHS